MKAQNKLLALILTLALAVGMLASCDQIMPPTDVTPDADSYTATVDIRFATNDAKMKSAIDAMNSSATIMRKGDDISVVTTSESDGILATESYILTGGMLFHSLSLKIGEAEQEVKQLAFVDDTNRAALIETLGAGAYIDAEDFESKSTNGSTTSCTDILEESRASLVNLMSKRFSAIGATVELGEVSLSVELDGELKTSTVLSCEYNISMGGESYSVIMRLYTDYNYKADVKVETPADASKYDSASLEDIIK